MVPSNDIFSGAFLRYLFTSSNNSRHLRVLLLYLVSSAISSKSYLIFDHMANCTLSPLPHRSKVSVLFLDSDAEDFPVPVLFIVIVMCLNCTLFRPAFNRVAECLISASCVSLLHSKSPPIACFSESDCNFPRLWAERGSPRSIIGTAFGWDRYGWTLGCPFLVLHTEADIASTYVCNKSH